MFSLTSQRKLTFLFYIFKNLPEEDEDGKTPTQPLLKKGRHFPPFCVKPFFRIVNFSFLFVLLSTHIIYERGNINDAMSTCFFISALACASSLGIRLWKNATLWKFPEQVATEKGLCMCLRYECWISFFFFLITLILK